VRCGAPQPTLVIGGIIGGLVRLGDDTTQQSILVGG
jgi:hypothetical protein